MKRYGITFPIVLDNSYGTWNAYENSYWPRKYLIDINGKVVFDHIGEGGYEETEHKIQELLAEKMTHNQQATTSIPTGTVQLPDPAASVQNASPNLSPETYFGSDRNAFLGNGIAQHPGVQRFTLPAQQDTNSLLLDGTWNMIGEYASNQSPRAKIVYRYRAQNVFFVASAKTPVRVNIFRDGKPLPLQAAGSDVQFDGDQSYILVQDERLYTLIQDKAGTDEHALELQVTAPGLNAYTFTFG